MAALALAHFFAYKPKSCWLHAYVDRPRGHKDNIPELRKMFDALVEGKYIESVYYSPDNQGLTQMVSRSIEELATSGAYDYVARYEDDMLIGPNILSMMIDAFEKSTEMDRPLGLLGGQVTHRPPALKPIRFKKVGPYVVGVHGVDNLEGLTLLRAEMGKKGFTWPLEHPRAYNNAWLNKLQAINYDGGSIIEPVGLVQHIGHRTTVPHGTPITPAKQWSNKITIDLPEFKWSRYIGSKTETGEYIYSSKIIRQICTRLDPKLADIFLNMVKGAPIEYVPPPTSNYTAPFANRGDFVRESVPQERPRRQGVPTMPAPVVAPQKNDRPRKPRRAPAPIKPRQTWSDL